MKGLLAALRLSVPLRCLPAALLAACSLGSNCTGEEPPADEHERRPADPALPGLGKGDPALMKRLDAALEAKGAGYEPRTHHLTPDGEPEYTNRLILETSPYLLQHAHNPVNWYPWGDEAFERAKREGKPVLLSVGYSTCHWCHVMERESFEDEQIAKFINQHYIPIKVDREERPDVDDVYMRAVRMLSGDGGWPMTVIMTPDRRPFFGGTYFPARDGDRGAKKGFLTILEELAGRYADDRDALVRRAKELTQRLQSAAAPSRPGSVPGPRPIDRAARGLARSFDPVWGGFGRAPKFPRPVTLELLLRYHRRTKDPGALRIVTHTLEQMARGGMYDHVGGGFHRYSTDARWLVPHFEKMLYDNAQLVMAYLAAYQVTDRADFAAVARETLRYVGREMTSPKGAFYSATDAESPTPSGEQQEGWFFTWTPGELRAAVGPELARVVEAVYGVTPSGNFEGRNILHRQRPAKEVTAELDLPPERIEAKIEEAKPLLYEARRRRPPPLRDEKILTAWNGLMISAFARAAFVLGERTYATRAARAASFLLTELRTKRGALHRTFKDGRARHRGYLDDYAFLIQGLLDLYETTSEPRWLDQALALQSRLDELHWDDERGGYFMTSERHEKLLTRDKPSYDGGEPAGNSVALLNLLRLGELTSEDRYRKRAERTLAAFATDLTRSPGASPLMLSGLEFYLDTPREVLVVTPPGGDGAAPLVGVVRETYLPNRIFVVTREGPPLAEHAKRVPVLEGKSALRGRATAFVCERGRCELPTSKPEVFSRQLSKVVPLMEKEAREPLPVADPGSRPKPWQYDPKTNRHWHPKHGHWHEGRPPKGR